MKLFHSMLSFGQIAIFSALMLGGQPSKASSLQTHISEPSPSAQEIRVPQIRGDTLLIEGVVAAHLVGFLLAREKDLTQIKVVELNSVGGNVGWAFRVSAIIKAKGWSTRVSKGQFCASSCVILFAAGRDREASATSQFVVHGARPERAFFSTFLEKCLIYEGVSINFNFNEPECKSRYRVAETATMDLFRSMESNGVSTALREKFFSMPQDPLWPLQMNVLEKSDLFLTGAEASQYRLVTRVVN